MFCTHLLRTALIHMFQLQFWTPTEGIPLIVRSSSCDNWISSYNPTSSELCKTNIMGLCLYLILKIFLAHVKIFAGLSQKIFGNWAKTHLNTFSLLTKIILSWMTNFILKLCYNKYYACYTYFSITTIQNFSQFRL